MNQRTKLDDFLSIIREHPNSTALRVNGEIVTNALFAQRIAPIINEFDSIPNKYIALMIEDDIQVYAAFPAAVLSRKILVPMKSAWSKTQCDRVLSDVGLSSYLTAQRMQYYFRMTYADALDRIDNGLFEYSDDQCVAILYDFDANESLNKKTFYLKDFPSTDNVLKYIADFFAKW